MHGECAIMEDSTEFGELAHDEDFKAKIRDLEENLGHVEKMVQDFCSLNVYDNLSPPDKVRYELFQAFAISSLYWFYLRIKGIDPNQNEIRTELNRIKEFMARSKEIYGKQNLMPRINQEAAKRFVKSSLWTPNQFSDNDESNMEQDVKSRKRKRESDEDDNDFGGQDDSIKFAESAKPEQPEQPEKLGKSTESAESKKPEKPEKSAKPAKSDRFVQSAKSRKFTRCKKFTKRI